MEGNYPQERQSMKTLQRPIVIARFLVILTLLTQGRAVAEDRVPQSGIQTTMHAFFQALTRVFPWSLDEQQFQDPAHRQDILDALRVPPQQAGQLETHGQHGRQSFDFLRRSLVQSAQDAGQRYEQGQYQQARFLLQGLTEKCFACHSRLPNLQRFDLGKRFLEATPLESLPVRQRIKLEVATRQFDTALTTCEAFVRSPGLTAADIGLTSVFEDYLTLIIRVRNDFPRAITTFEAFLQRPDVPASVRAQLVHWVDALKELGSHGPTTDALPRARALIETGQLRNRFPADQQGLVHFVVASSLLHRSLNEQAANQSALAETYYLLGIAESYIARTSWISETAFFLETAIRLDPTSAVAAKAYDVLNAYILTQYTGSSGLHVPSEVEEHLEELRRLRGGS
jgi:hypothetical protein